MRKIFFLPFFIFISFQIYSQSHYQVYMTLSFSDCINCVQPVRSFSKIPASLNPKVVFKLEDKRIAKKFLEKNLQTIIPDESIIYSDSLFLALNKGNKLRSFIHITWKNEVEQSFMLSSFNLQDILLFDKVQFKANKLPLNNVILGNGLSIRKSSSNIFVLDTQFNKLFVFDTQKRLIRTIDENDFPLQETYKRIFGDTVGYYQRVTRFEKEIASVGKTKTAISNVYLSSDGSVFLDLLMFYALPDPKTEGLGVYPATVIVKQIEKGFVNHKALIPKSLNDNTFNLLPSFAFDIYTKIAYTLNFYTKPDTSMAFVSKLKINNSSFEFDSFTKLKFPAFAVKSKTDYMFVTGKMLYPYYFFSLENLVGNIETGKYSVLNDLEFTNNYEELLKTFDFHYTLLDVIKINEKLFRYLVNYKGKYFIYDFDGEKSTLLKEIMLPSKKNFISEFTFANHNTLLAITPDNELMEILF